MDFRLWWLILGIVLVIVETFIGTLDSLAIGIASIITAILIKIFGVEMIDRKIAAGIFLLSSIITVMITRLLVLPKVKGKDGPEPMSGEAIIGTELNVQEVNDKQVVRYEGVYWKLESQVKLVEGDMVKVTAMHGNHLVVEKL